MTKKRYRVVCLDGCGEIEADTVDGLYTQPTAHRRAGHHEGANDHLCDVEVSEETPEYRCPVCHHKCIGKDERDKHAKTEPGVQPSSFVRV